MTSHAIDREEVMAYVDGALDASRSAVVEGHLNGCADCRSLAGELRLVSQRLAAWRVEDAPGRRVVPIAAAVTAVPRRHGWWPGRTPWWIPRWAIAGGLAAVALAFVAVAQFGVRSRPSELVPSLATEPAAAAIPVESGQLRTGTQVGEAARPAATQRLSGSALTTAARRSTQGVIAGAGGGSGGTASSQAPDRMIVRTAEMVMTSDRFDQIRSELERLVAAQQGRLTSLNVSGDPADRRSLRATVGVPAARMEALLAGLRTLGRVQEESLGSDDVTESFRDLGLRTANARREEQRLVELLTRRTGDLSDVLAVERELARVRLDIERMEAETRATRQRVDFAKVTLTVQEQYRADLAIGRLPLNLRFKNAIVDGLRGAMESLLATALFVLQVAPVIIVWGLLLFFPARWAWRRASTAMPRA
jgi:hypothetical protein